MARKKNDNPIPNEPEAEEKKPEYSAAVPQPEWEIRPSNIDFEPPLLTCLSVLSALLNKPVSRQALKAGLPDAGENFTPELAVRAAERAGFSARIVHKKDVRNISQLTMPCIILLKNKNACILTKLNVAKGTAEIISSESGGGASTVPLKTLMEDYLGVALFIRAKFEFDARSTYEASRYEGHWFWGTLKRFMPVYSHVVLASVLINIFAIASPLFTMNIYDRVVPNAAMDTLWVLAIGVTTVFIFDFILRNLRSYFVDIAGRNADTIIAARLLEHVMGMRMDKKPESTGAIANNLRDFESLRDFFTSGTITAFVDLPFIFLFIFIIYLIAGPLALIPLLAVPIVLIVGYLLQYPLQKIIERTHIESTQKHALLVETLTGLETIKTSNASSRIQSRWEKAVALTAESSTKGRAISTLATSFASIATQLVTVLVMIAGVMLITEGELTTGALVATSILTGRALAPLGQIAAMLIRFQQSRVSLDALQKLMETPLERPIGKVFHHIGTVQGQIEFQNVTFSYPGQTEKALDKVSFAIKPGERVGILGRIGSGKTTLGKLLHALYEPQEGSILIDGIDIHQIDPIDIRKNIGYVGQDNFLFYGSVRDNIVFGAPQLDEKAVQRAAQIAGVTDFLSGHPLGMDLPVGERGMSLSGGQRQAVAVARALVTDPSILLMDEPTSNMDNTTQMRFMQRLNHFVGNRTFLFISHRTSLLTMVNRLIVLDNGKIVADGPKEDVIRKLGAGEVKKG